MVSAVDGKLHALTVRTYIASPSLPFPPSPRCSSSTPLRFPLERAYHAKIGRERRSSTLYRRRSPVQSRRDRADDTRPRRFRYPQIPTSISKGVYDNKRRRSCTPRRRGDEEEAKKRGRVFEHCASCDRWINRWRPKFQDSHKDQPLRRLPGTRTMGRDGVRRTNAVGAALLAENRRRYSGTTLKNCGPVRIMCVCLCM